MFPFIIFCLNTLPFFSRRAIIIHRNIICNYIWYNNISCYMIHSYLLNISYELSWGLGTWQFVALLPKGYLVYSRKYATCWINKWMDTWWINLTYKTGDQETLFFSSYSLKIPLRLSIQGHSRFNQIGVLWCSLLRSWCLIDIFSLTVTQSCHVCGIDLPSVLEKLGYGEVNWLG